MRVAYAVSALFLAGAPFGCSALLGDFTAGSATNEDAGGGETGAPIPDAGGDTTAPPPDSGSDGTTPIDAPPDVVEEPDAAPPLELLSCGSLLSPAPTTLLSIPPFDSGVSGNNFPIQNMYVEHLPGANQVRVAVASGGASGNVTTLYTVQESGGGVPASITFPNTGIQAEHKTATAMLLLLRRYQTNDYALYAIDDTDPGTNPGEVPVAILAQPPQAGNGDFRASIIDTGASSYFVLASYATATAGQYAVASWTSSTGQWQVRPGETQGLGVDGPLVDDAVNAYQFLGPPGPGGSGGPTTLYEYTFPLADGGSPATRQITVGSATAAMLAAAHPSTGYELEFVELTTAQSGNYRAGLIDPSKLDSFVVDDLPLLSFKPGGDAGFFDTTPFGNQGGGSRWLSNGDFGSMGTGGTGGGSYTGLNFYVGTTSGQWIIETAGTGQNLLSGVPVTSATFDLSSAVSEIVFTFDVAWTQQLGDGTAVLYFNMLNCQL